MEVMYDSVVPLYQQVADDLKQRIEKGEYMAGQMIPSEAKLCEMYQVSRITIRSAISKLVEEEVLVKRHGKGTFVQTTKIPSELLSFAGFTTTMKQRNYDLYTHMLASERQTASPKIAKLLGISEGAAIVYLKRMRYINHHAVILEHVYLPYEKYGFLLDVDLENKSMYAAINEKIGFNPEHSCNSYTTLEASDATAEEAALLELNENNAVIVMGEKVVKPSGEVVHFTKQVYAGSAFKFSMFNRAKFMELDMTR